MGRTITAWPISFCKSDSSIATTDSNWSMAATALRSFFLTGPAIVFRWVQRATQTKLKRNSDSFFVYALNSFPGQIVTIFTRDDLGEVREHKGGGLFSV